MGYLQSFLYLWLTSFVTFHIRVFLGSGSSFWVAVSTRELDEQSFTHQIEIYNLAVEKSLLTFIAL